MPPSIFPLRWESTGNQWWYASPIDWAAANGHFDLVRELLRIDTNLLIKLTSLRRIRRLEIVWDDDAQFADVAKCRSIVAQNLLNECQTKKGKNSLIRAGYGGWLLYTAASAGDVEFIQELLARDPLIVFGEGEYGVTDIFYAAARSKNSEVFRLLFDYAVWPRCVLRSGGELGEQKDGIPSVFKWEMMNRAAHAAARGGNLEILKELLAECSDVMDYKDAQGSTVLHAAAGRGQVEIVKDLVSSFDIITSIDNQGNTALHVAAYRGHLSVVEALIHASPSSISLTNNSGDTFLHMVIAGFRTPGFRRVDRQIELMNQLVIGEVVNLQEIINMKNNDGRTALHMAVIGNIHSNLVELLMSVPSIELNIRDINGMTPLDILCQHPRSASSEILIKQLISAGGISNSRNYMARSAIASHLKMQGIGGSPGTSFKISDAEIFLHTGFDNASDASGDRGSRRLSSCSSTSKSEISPIESANASCGSSGNKRPMSVNSAAKRLKMLLRWPGRKEKKTNFNSVDLCKMSGDDDSVDSYKKSSDLENTPTPLRQRFSKPSALPNNKRTLSVRTSLPSPSTKKKFSQGLMHGVLQAMPHLAFPSNSASTSRSRSPLSSPTMLDKQKGAVLSDNEASGPSFSKSSGDEGSNSASPKTSSANIRMMNQYFCFGAQDLAVEEPVPVQPSNRAYKPSVLSMA
ncbi:Ankyrin repeat [Cinnamomum micranthum f. kanehirae]|uniref:Ankyrin repeat n=1 Tax=Cinnamomum micranthum f. kanehirae TaxID=337451 RepID=A0A3S3M8V8_9MAGN|nr:Ankyrin repeat [Cinnamomum micranthum f. kanehirae]